MFVRGCARSKRLWLLAAAIVLYVLATQVLSIRFSLYVNLSHSLPGILYLVDKSKLEAQRGDLIAFWFDGTDLPVYPRSKGPYRFLKLVKGVESDIIKIDNSEGVPVMYVNNEMIGTVLSETKDGYAVHPLQARSVPQGYYFVAGIDPRSFDSRYEEVGLVPTKKIIGVAYRLL